MMKGKKIFALAIGALMTVSLLAGCGDNGQDDADGAILTRICYDNLDSGYIPASETKAVVKGVNKIIEENAQGASVAAGTVAEYDSGTGTFTAKSQGTVYYQLSDKTWGRIEVVPAYATDPGNQYTGNTAEYDINSGAKYLGNTHDPSFIEVVDEGYSTYYLFSTGWDVGNDIHSSVDGGITWSYEGKTFATGDFNDPEILPADLINWMGAKNNSKDIQWWAPDIVPAQGGGYWLYTCTVMSDDVIKNATHAGTDYTPGTNYSRAAIVLFWTESLTRNWSTNATKRTGSFEYKGVLMQSAIPQNSGYSGIDVNSIDPQIVYDTDGKMYMSYGSFGTGNWLLELDPATGLRKDNVYTDEDGDGFVDFKTFDYVRRQRNFAVSGSETDMGSTSESANKYYSDFKAGNPVETDFYGKMISLGNMEAPIINRHDNVTVTDETAEYDESGNPVGATAKSYYYSMHSYNGLGVNYQMWGGRSESVWGMYQSTGGGLVLNVNIGQSANQGNKYMGAFKWRDASKSAGNKEIDIVLPGHNDLYTAQNGTNLAAYITRTFSYKNNVVGSTANFFVQIHQYYLNSMGDICINPNRYGGEIDRYVSEEELFEYTDDGRFEMVVLTNQADAPISDATGTSTLTGALYNESMEVKLDRNTHKILKGGAEIGSWVMYGKGYIKFTFTETLKGARGYDSNETVYYGVVRPAWLGNRNQSGFTISCMGNTAGNTQSMAMFMNNYSTIEL